MFKRDTYILIMAVVCGLVAFVLVANYMKKASLKSPTPNIIRTTPESAPQLVAMAIPQGMRALTLAKEKVDNLPETLKVGDYIDIIGSAPTYEGSHEKELQTIVRAAQVIAVDKSDESSIRSFVAAVSPVGAVLVSRAMADQKISVAIRTGSENNGVLQSAPIGFTEVIKGVNKETSMKLNRGRADN